MIAMPSFRYGDKTYEYSVQLLDSRKKSISIHVLPDATVEVKAPAHTSAQKVIETMSKRARWIVRHVEKIQQQRSLILPREYISGETHYYMGRRYVLKVVQSDVEQAKLTRGRFVVQCKEASKEKVKVLLAGWYKEHAHQVFDRRLKAIVSGMEWLDKAPPMTVRLMKKQWGSCSPRGRISLNWNLVKAPMDCIDYVITHELCHLQEHNHSKRYYTLMDRHTPEWRPIKAKLDGMSELLLNE
jgi:predicted metal-dependent hydrolase